MAALLILSVDKGTGKTAIAAAVGKCLAGVGKKVAFLKSPGSADGDAAFIKQALSLPDSLEAMSHPVDQLKEAYARLSPGKDVVLIEGTIGTAKPDQTYIELAKDGRVLLVETYPAGHPETYPAFTSSLMGVIVNKVPKSRLGKVRAAETARLNAAGVKLLGIIPEDRPLLAPTVAELAAGIQGKILSSAENSGRLVENIMVGAMCVDSGPVYYSRKSAKAAVLRWDRPDMQLAALETDTACMVLAGGSAPPVHSVAFKAENKGIPVIITARTINDIIADIESTLDGVRFDQEQKLSRFGEIMRQNADLPAICGLGAAK